MSKIIKYICDECKIDTFKWEELTTYYHKPDRIDLCDFCIDNYYKNVNPTEVYSLWVKRHA